MSVVEPGSFHSKLVERVKAILTRPSPTWEVIATESTSVADLYRGYIVPLAAIPPAAEFIGRALFNMWRPSEVFALPALAIGLLVQYALTLGLIYVVGLIIDGLAPSFDGTRNRIQAFKVAAYSFTAAWVAGVFQLIPWLGWLGILGLYSIYLLYKGLPRLMRSPEDKAVPYVAVIVLISMFLYIVVFAIASPMQRVGAPFWAAADSRHERQREARENLGEERHAARRAPVERLEAGDAAALPASIGGFRRTQQASGEGGFAGVEGSVSTAEYEKPGAKLTLVVTDMGPIGALAALGGRLEIESTSEGDGSYERVGKVDGRFTIEEYDAGRKHGSYGVVVGERFMIQAEGDGVTMDDLKAAVAAVDDDRLEDLAKEAR